MVQNLESIATATELRHMKFEEDLEQGPLLFRHGRINQWKESFWGSAQVTLQGVKVEAGWVNEQAKYMGKVRLLTGTKEHEKDCMDKDIAEFEDLVTFRWV